MATTDVTHEPSPREILAAADAEIAEADARAEEIERAVEAGDSSVTFEQVEAAERQSRWARMRRAGAEKRAEEREQQLRRDEYERVVRDVVPVALHNVQPEVDAIWDEVRPLVRKALQLIADRNIALIAVARYGSDPATWKGDPGEGEEPLYGYVQPGGGFALTSAEISLGGPVHRYRSSHLFVSQLLKPLRQEIRDTGGTTTWLDQL